MISETAFCLKYWSSTYLRQTSNLNGGNPLKQKPRWEQTMAMRTHGGDKSSKGKNIPLVNLGLIPILISLIDLLKGEQV